MSGRPFTRTSCLAEPKRVELPAASTTTWMWLASVPEASVTSASAFGEQPDGESRDHAHAGDQRGLSGHLGEGRAWDHFQYDENREGGQRQNGDAGKDSRHTAVVANFGSCFLWFEVHGGGY